MRRGRRIRKMMLLLLGLRLYRPATSKPEPQPQPRKSEDNNRFHGLVARQSIQSRSTGKSTSSEMLHRAASNAYSWWWASHVRTKHSKWLESNLQDMDEKVKHMLKLIDQDGDSFAKRTEMYYRKRPELISFVEESYRMYRALAERFDHLSGELQNANRTIATVFPEQVQYSMEEEEEERAEEEKSRPTTPLPVPSPKNLPEVPKGEIPKFLKFARVETEPSPKRPSPAMKKWQSKRRSSRLINVFDPNITEDEALKEIDKLQKRILASQTEKEFIKSSYESRIAKYCEIEKEIAEMQETVGHLRDEFSIAAAIEDNEARTIMASMALRSCQEALAQLQEKHDRSIEEARVEYRRVKDNYKKFDELKDEFFQNQEDENLNDDKETPVRNVAAAPLTLERFEVGNAQQERRESESILEKIKEHFEINSDSSFIVTELAEKIDELVTKVVSLETAVLSQNALMTRLKSDSDELQEHLHSVEEDKTMAIEDTKKLNEKLRKVEEELRAVQDLNRSIDTQNNNLDTHFTEAHSNLDHLSEKLEHAKELKEEETKAKRSSIQEAPFLSVHVELHDGHEDHLFELDLKPRNDYKSEADEKYHEAPGPSSLVIESTTSTSNSKDIHDDLCAKESQEQLKQPQWENDVAKKENKLSTPKENIVNPDPLPEFYSNKEHSTNWQELFLKGLDGREEVLLAEYTTVLRKYKEAKRRISDIESKNRETLFEITIQLRDLRNANNLKDEEIQSLRKSINVVQMNPAESCTPAPTESCSPAVATNISNQAPQLQLRDLLETHPIPQVTTDKESEKIERVKVFPVDEPEPHTISPIEEKFRRDINDVLEENLDFWLRFSTSFHQIQKFKTIIRDLESEYSKLKEKKKQESSTTSTTNYSLRSDARPIYKHLREIQTELTLWLEQNAHLKDELKSRLVSLGDIQEEISKILLLRDDESDQFPSYQAARFQGEILNMQQENNKVKNELQTGMEHVKRLQVDIEHTLMKMDKELNFSGTRTNMIHTITRARIPLRAFLFGVKAKKKKPPLFSCISPALQKQYSNLHGNIPV